MTLVLIDNDTAEVVRRVPQGEARREATLRDLIAEHPELLPVHDLDPSYSRLATVTRELNVPGVGLRRRAAGRRARSTGCCRV